MISVVTKDRAFGVMLKHTLSEAGFSAELADFTLNIDTAELAIVDLDSFSGKIPENAITFSRRAEDADREIYPDLVRPFLIDDFVFLVKSRLSSDFAESDRAFVGASETLRAKKKVSDFEFSDGVLRVKGEVTELSPTEAALFSLLYTACGGVVTTEEINRKIFNTEYGNAASVYINFLRKKLDFRLGKRMIVTVRGKGYSLAQE